MAGDIGYMEHVSRFVRNSDSDPRCGCEHPEGYHPDPSPRASASKIPSIVASYLTPKTILNPPSNAVASSSSSNAVASSSARRPTASSGSTSKAAASENATAIALAETNSGLKQKANLLEGTGSRGSRKKPKKAGDDGFPLTQPGLKQRAAVNGKEIVMGEIIIMVTQAKDRARKTFTTPPKDEVARWENLELTVNGMRTRLFFGIKWDARRMDQLFREKFPQFFAYMDMYFPLDPTADPEEFHWDLLIRTGKKLTVAPRVSPDGHEFLRWAGPSGVRTADRKIWLGSRHRISPDVWDHKNGRWIFDAPMESIDAIESVDAIESESDHYSSMEIESDGSWKGSVASSQRLSKSKKSRGKEKAKAKSQSPDLALFSGSDMEAEEEEDFEFPVARTIKRRSFNGTFDECSDYRTSDGHSGNGAFDGSSSNGTFDRCFFNGTFDGKKARGKVGPSTAATATSEPACNTCSDLCSRCSSSLNISSSDISTPRDLFCNGTRSSTSTPISGPVQRRKAHVHPFPVMNPVVCAYAAPIYSLLGLLSIPDTYVDACDLNTLIDLPLSGSRTPTNRIVA
ncbi:hypothetical protein DFH06DRAFT_1343127 [Mycena polygramma]|nr:hypothetical protein DFH06DRAFT_1343127 [Mycena polygramma]